MAADSIINGLEEDTTSASISYLPGSFDTARSLIDDLSRIKSRWNIKVLENEGSYVLTFEDVLSINIPCEHYDDFNKNVVAIEGVSYVDLTQRMDESIMEYQKEVYGKLYEALRGLKKNKHISSSTTLAKHWMHTFTNSKYVASDEKVALKLNNFDNDARKLAEELEKMHGDDIGEIDAIVDAIDEGRPLGGLEDYDYIAGVKIQSSHEGVILIAEFNVNSAMMCSQSIYISDADVLEELEGYSSVKALYKRVFPMGHEFQPSLFGNIRNIIDED